MKYYRYRYRVSSEAKKALEQSYDALSCESRAVGDEANADKYGDSRQYDRHRPMKSAERRIVVLLLLAYALFVFVTVSLFVVVHKYLRSAARRVKGIGMYPVMRPCAVILVSRAKL